MSIKMHARSCLRASLFLALSVAGVASASGRAATPSSAVCQRIVLAGEVSAGQEWKAALGQGWVLRVLPIDAAKTPSGLDPLSGWDLVVDREQPAGFPDALLLASPPYDSINEREIGTTFGLRAQDAIGWNPRSFRFLVSPQDLAEGQQLFRALHGKPVEAQRASESLIALSRQSAAGEFRILDARIVPGIADAAPFAENWALQSARTAHTIVPAAGRATPLGKLDWIRFSIVLWLPDGWKAPAELHASRGACSQ